MRLENDKEVNIHFTQFFASFKAAITASHVKQATTAVDERPAIVKKTFVRWKICFLVRF